jgi:hypothetical protein
MMLSYSGNPLFYFAFSFFGADLTGTIASSLLDVSIKAGVAHAPRTVGGERERVVEEGGANERAGRGGIKYDYKNTLILLNIIP